MSLCKLEFFDRNMNYKHHAIADIEEIDDDYLAPEKNEVLIDKTTKVEVNQFVWITGEYEFFGIVTEIGTSDDQTKVCFEPFVSLFNRDVLIPADFESNSLEEMLSHVIYVFWATPYPVSGVADGWQNYATPRGKDPDWDIKMVIRLHPTITNPKIGVTNIHTSNILPTLPTIGARLSNDDTLHGAFGCVLISDYYKRASLTTDYALEISQDEFGQGRMKVNLFNDILSKAMKYYGIVIQARPDFAHSCIEVLVSTPSGYTLKAFEETSDTYHAAAEATMPVIMADDPSITIEAFTLDSASNDANTLTIYSTSNKTLSATYYLNNDGRSPAYSTEYTTNEDGTKTRILPPKYALAYTSGTGTTFTNTNAPKTAKEFFKDLIWNSSIELKFTRNDPMFEPHKIKIGQLCKIWHNEKCYISMLTARKLGDETILTFGSVRTTLTKQMKLEKKKKK